MRLIGLLFIVLICSFASTSRAQEQDNARRENWDAIHFESGKDELIITNVEKVPRQLLRVAWKQGCRFNENNLAAEPVQIFRIRREHSLAYIALVPCANILYRDTQVFYFAPPISQEPMLVQLAVRSRHHGFETTSVAGHLDWDNTAQKLTALRGSDTCPSPSVRHVYSFNAKGTFFPNGSSPFVLESIEILDNGCSGENNWRVIWSAEQWPPP